MGHRKQTGIVPARHTSFPQLIHVLWCLMWEREKDRMAECVAKCGESYCLSE